MSATRTSSLAFPAWTGRLALPTGTVTVSFAPPGRVNGRCPVPARGAPAPPPATAGVGSAGDTRGARDARRGGDTPRSCPGGGARGPPRPPPRHDAEGQQGADEDDRQPEVPPEGLALGIPLVVTKDDECPQAQQHRL